MTNLAASQYLLLTGHLQGKASFPAYTRLAGTVGLQTHFVEFLTARTVNNASAPLSSLVNQIVNIEVPIGQALFFSDYPPPPDPQQAIAAVAAGTSLHNFQIPSGMVGSDGAAVTPKREKGIGPVFGLAATAHGGAAYDLTLSTSTAKLPGRVSGTKATWIFARAVAKRNAEPPVTLALAYAPSNLLLRLAIFGDNIQSAVQVDLSAIVGAAGNAMLSRTVTYRDVSFSSQKLIMPANQTAAPMPLAASPVRERVDALEYFAPALAAVVGGLAQPAQAAATPLIALASITPTVQESEQAFVGRAVALAAPAIAPLAAALAASTVPGVTDTAHWLGWMMSEGIGKTDFAGVFADYHQTFVAWAKAQGAAGPTWNRWREMLTPDPDQGPAHQAVDKLLGD